jgi:radical SAM protein with 4Fe4S-binding SPASM domain
MMPSAGKMTVGSFRRIFDLFSGYAEWVGLYNWGEPLLHPDLFDMVRYVSRHGVRSIISTHFNVEFSERAALELVNSGLSRLIVSLDGATQETYGKYRAGGSFDRVIDNLDTLIESKARLRSAAPEIVIQFIVFRHNEHEIDAISALARRMACKLSLIPATCDMGQVVEMPPQEAARQCTGWLPVSPSHRQYDTSGKWSRTTRICPSLWNTLVLRWDGEVFPCCLPYKDEHSLGNILSQTFESIWNGPEMRHARSLFVTGKPLTGPVMSVCDLCYNNRGWNVQRLAPSGVSGILQTLGNALLSRLRG